MGITICDTHLTRTVRYLSLTFEPVYINYIFCVLSRLAKSTNLNLSGLCFDTVY